MTAAPVWLDMRATARAVGRTYQWFRQNRARLMLEHGFPPPQPGGGRPLWRADQVAAWGTEPQVTIANPTEYESALRRLAGGRRLPISRM